MKVVVEFDLGNDEWIHREVEMPFLPVEDMVLEFELVGMSEDGKNRRYASFRVVEVTWVERDQRVYVEMEAHEDEEENLSDKSLFNMATWRDGYADPWVF